MSTRRSFLKSGLGALSYGLLGPKAFGIAPPYVGSEPPPDCAPSGGIPLAQSNPIIDVPNQPPDTIEIAGLPFANSFGGDVFPNDEMPFHAIPDYFNGGGPPAPQEEVDVAVVGGGMSGLAAAWLLRRYRPVIFEPHERFGGNAVCESWRNIQYPLGSAYVITPDPGTFLNRFYRQLGLHRVRRESFPPDPAVWQGDFVADLAGVDDLSNEERAAFERYAEVVTFMAEEAYPEIPLPDDPAEIARIHALDRQTFRENVEQQMGMPLTPILTAALQGYFFSSFDAGIDTISAAAGWNFVAAEEFGRWVFPGGNGYLVWALWDKIRRWENRLPSECRPHYLRARCTVIDVRPLGKRLQVTWLDSTGAVRSLAARQVVMAGGKHVMKHVLHDIRNWDPEKYEAMDSIHTNAYLMANVLLNRPIERDFYDCFLINDAGFPADENAFEARPIVTDMLRGDFAQIDQRRAVLTLYHPLPYPSARFAILLNNPLPTWAEMLAPQIRAMLNVLDVPESAVRQVRMARWGHAMPIARVNFIADGMADRARRPIEDRVHFVNQDNFALPAVENSLLEAERVADEIKDLLG